MSEQALLARAELEKARLAEQARLQQIATSGGNNGTDGNPPAKDDLGNDTFNTTTIGGTPIPTDKGSNQANLGAYTYGILNRCGVFFMDIPVLQGAIPFQHQDRMPFSPFTTDITTVDNLFMLALTYKGLKTENFKAFADLLKSYMQQVANIFDALSISGTSNWANHTSATMMQASMLHRLGMLDDQGLVRVQEHARSVFDKLYTKDVALGALEGITTLVNGARTHVESQRGENQKDMASEGGLAAIAKVLSSLK